MMKSTNGISVFKSTTMLGVLMLALLVGLQEVGTATESNNLTVDHIIDRV